MGVVRNARRRASARDEMSLDGVCEPIGCVSGLPYDFRHETTTALGADRVNAFADLPFCAGIPRDQLHVRVDRGAGDRTGECDYRRVAASDLLPDHHPYVGT